MPALVAISASACLFLFLVYLVRARGLRSPEMRIQRLSPSRDVSVGSGGDGGSFLKRNSSSIPAISRWIDTRGYAERWTFELERADLNLRPGEYFMMRLLLAVLVGAVVALIGRNAVAVVAAIPLGAMIYMLPAQWVKLRTRRRIAKINGQLVETITLIMNGVRAGFAFGQSVDVAAKRVGPPISVELNRMLLDVNLGGSMEDALSAFNERIGSDDVDMLVTAILIQRTSGGNLAEILESIGDTIQDRERIHGEIKTLTSSQRLTGWILSLWPAALALMFFAIAPSIMSLLWTTTAGLFLMGIWITLNVLGVFSIRRILDIDI
jgi:tight adherence protein B